jgi:predicted 2-oxoglutarate/Fe(II)-dependent dioxygenase YbiX
MQQPEWVAGFEPRDHEPCFCGSARLFVDCCGNPAPDRAPPHGLILKKNWLSAGQCDALVAILEQQPRSWLTIRPEKRGEGVRDPTRVTESVELGAARDEIFDHVRRALLEVAEPEMNCRIDWFWTPDVLRYGSGGHYAGHADSQVRDPETNLWKRIIDRDVSMLMYLNEDFIGGHVAFPKFKYRYLPRKGDLLLFPSDNAFLHRAEPVQSGLRYSVVTWATHEDGPRVDLPPFGRTNFLRPKGGSSGHFVA